MEGHGLGRPVATALAAALIALPAAHASPGDVYLGGSIGMAQATDFGGGAINRALERQGLNVRTADVDETSTGWKVFAGYQFNPNLAVEGGYTSLGKFDFHGQVIADPGAVQARFEAAAWHAAVLGIVPTPVGPQLFCKIGVDYWQTKLAATGTFSGAGAHTAESNGISPLVGLGATYRVSPSWTVRVEAERYFSIGSTSGSGRTDIDFWSLGIHYHF